MPRNTDCELATPTSTASLNMPPHISTSVAPSTSTNEPAIKKRKLEDDTMADEAVSDDSRAPDRVTFAGGKWEKRYYRAEEKYLKEKELRLNYQNKLNDKDYRAIKKDEEIVNLRMKITQRDTIITELEQNDHRLREKIADLKTQNIYLKQHVSAPPRRLQKSCVPHPDLAVRNDDRYTHPNAPVGKRFKHSRSSHVYAVGTGKVRPVKYGPNSNWDLGLCEVTFETNRFCTDTGCEYRHEALTSEERMYMGLLDPVGPGFLKHSDICLHIKCQRFV
jgi:hypothetical protein